jgi:hypothetical protein
LDRGFESHSRYGCLQVGATGIEEEEEEEEKDNELSLYLV